MHFFLSTKRLLTPCLQFLPHYLLLSISIHGCTSIFASAAPSRAPFPFSAATNGSKYFVQSPTVESPLKSGTINWLIIKVGVPNTERMQAFLNEKRVLASEAEEL